MANNLHRVLTSYVAEPATVDHPDKPKSGDACRVGRNVGVALVNEQFGYASGGYRELDGFQVNKPYDPINLNDYTDGQTPVVFQQNQWKLPVRNVGAAAVANGAIVYYWDDPADAELLNSVNMTVGLDISAAADAIAGVLRQSLAANTTQADAIVEIFPSIVTTLMLTPTA